MARHKRHAKLMRRRRHLLHWWDRRSWLGKRTALDVVDDDGMRERICFDRAYLETWAVPA